MTGSLDSARSSHTAVMLKTGKVLVVGGSARHFLRALRSQQGAWSKAASTNVSRGSNTTTLLQDGKVLTTGGVAGGRFSINSAELYDPAANTWTLTGSMTIGRHGHTATLLRWNRRSYRRNRTAHQLWKGLYGVHSTAKVDIYNEASGKFTVAASLTRALAYHSTTLMASGEALTSGGSGTTAYCCMVVNTAEIYTPLTMTFSSSSLNFGLLQIGLASASRTAIVTNVSSRDSSRCRRT